MSGGWRWVWCGVVCGVRWVVVWCRVVWFGVWCEVGWGRGGEGVGQGSAWRGPATVCAGPFLARTVRPLVAHVELGRNMNVGQWHGGYVREDDELATHGARWCHICSGCVFG